MVNHRNKSLERCRLLSAVLCCGFLLGSLLGAVWAGGLDANQTEQLHKYISEYLSVTEQTDVAVAFGSIFWNHFRWYLCLLLLGVSFPGMFFLPVLFGFRSFLLTFSLGCFLRIFGGVGLIPGLILLGLPSFLWIPAMWITASSVPEYCLFRSVPKSNSSQTPSRPGCDFGAALGAGFILIFLCVFLEYLVIPELFSVAARMIT